MIVADQGSVGRLLEALRRVLGWAPPARRVHDVYFLGLRNPSDACGPWDDVLGALEATSAGWRVWLWRGTTDPGRESGGHRDGVACLLPGVYPGCWALGHHKGDSRRPALVQRQQGVFRVWRDVRADGRVQRGGTVYANVAGLNAHGPGPDHPVGGASVGGFSLGCQVTKTEADHAERMALAYAQRDAGLGSTFSYRLLDLGDAPELLHLLELVGVKT